MHIREVLAVVAGLIALAAAIPYLIDIIKGKTKPNIVTWVTWSMLTIIGTAAAFAGHEPRTAYLILGDTVANILTVGLGLKYGIAKFTLFDGLCQIGAVSGLLLWLLFNSPVIAIVMVLAVDFFGLLPTLRHAWIKPQEETWQTFLIITGASILTLLSLNTFSAVSLSYPLYLLSANVSIVIVVIWRRKQLRLTLSR